jgi:hypothetical protein
MQNQSTEKHQLTPMRYVWGSVVLSLILVSGSAFLYFTYKLQKLGIEQQAKLEHLQSEISLLTLYQSHLAKYGKQNAAAYFATSTTP